VTVTGETHLVSTIRELRALVAPYRARGSVVAFVPTMGALHEGHLALVRRAQQIADVVVVSIFVNPLQFSSSEDLDRYPHTLDTDVASLAESGVAVVFVPPVSEIYPDGAAITRISAGPVADRYEGVARPGHFSGVLTVVAKLFNIVSPDIAVFGQKDAQQVFLVREMVHDLNLRVRVEALPTVREPDGLALSSRNRLLLPGQRSAALTLSTALRAADAAARRGAASAVAAGVAVFAAQSEAQLDYFDLVDPVTFARITDDARGDAGSDALALVAARVGSVRLIDNARIALG